MAPAALAASAPTVETTELHGFVSEATARFLGTVNPNGAQIQSCLFEYGTTTAYGHSIPCDKYPEADEAGTTPYVVRAQAEGLAPQTTYHYRLLADNGTGPVDGGDRTLTTAAPQPPPGECPNQEIRQQQGSTYLRDCMAYELVSPADTNSQDVETAIAAADGDHVWIASGPPLQPNQVTGNVDTHLMTRSAGGWTGRDLGDPNLPTFSAGPILMAPDSSSVLIERCDYRAVVCAGPSTYERVADQGGIKTMFTSLPSAFLPAPFPTIDGGSTDLSSVVFQTLSGEPPLLPDDLHTFGRGLYRSTLGTVENLAIAPDGSSFACGAALASNPPGANTGAGFGQDGLSADARTVVFASPDPDEVAAGHCSGPIDLYVRGPDDTTVDISAPQNGNPDQGATYVGNTQDGNVVYFVTSSALTPDDTDAARDIYAYDIASQTLTRLTPDADLDVGGRPSVQVAPNGDYVYFVALNPIGGQGAAGAQNLFVLHDGAIHLIVSTQSGYIFLGQPIAVPRTSPVTPDGTHLAFFSDAPLTAQDTGGTDQIFQYSATSAELQCVSCRPDGAPPTHEPDLHFPSVGVHVQSDDGRSILFETAESLVPQDINNVQDAYLWRDGQLSLVSSGRSPQVSTAIGMSADGRTMFFSSYESLAPESRQDSGQIYAARLGGGFRSPSPSPPCEGDSCQASPEPPSPDSPASRTFLGPGNVRLRTARRGRSGHPSKAQRLKRALRACRAKHGSPRRERCEARARRRFAKAGSFN